MCRFLPLAALVTAAFLFGMMGCGEEDVPFSPEVATTDPNQQGILTLL